MESNQGLVVERGSIRNRDMATMMMMLAAVMIVVVIGLWMMIVTPVVVMLMRMSTAVMIGMDIFMYHSSRHSCESAEGEELFDEKCHALP
jgi:hypothetical protein